MSKSYQEIDEEYLIESSSKKIELNGLQVNFAFEKADYSHSSLTVSTTKFPIENEDIEKSFQEILEKVMANNFFEELRIIKFIGCPFSGFNFGYKIREITFEKCKSDFISINISSSSSKIKIYIDNYSYLKKLVPNITKREDQLVTFFLKSYEQVCLPEFLKFISDFSFYKFDVILNFFCPLFDTSQGYFRMMSTRVINEEINVIHLNLTSDIPYRIAMLHEDVWTGERIRKLT